MADENLHFEMSIESILIGFVLVLISIIFLKNFIPGGIPLKWTNTGPLIIYSIILMAMLP